jgi:hypothetical protein
MSGTTHGERATGTHTMEGCVGLSERIAFLLASSPLPSLYTDQAFAIHA